MDMQTNRPNPAALIGGVLLITLGLLFLAGQVLRDLNWGLIWSFPTIGFGALFFVAMFASGKQAAGLAIPGSIIGGIGTVLLFQNITHHWETMSYIWTLIILFVGTGIYIMGWYSGDENQKDSGMRVMKVGFILLIIIGVFFEMIFSPFRNFIFPILLILLGIYLVAARSKLLTRRENNSTDSILMSEKEG
jgi:peptidoglycan/LPS O-acetylase OafA/YrhL